MLRRISFFFRKQFLVLSFIWSDWVAFHSISNVSFARPWRENGKVSKKVIGEFYCSSAPGRYSSRQGISMGPSSSLVNHSRTPVDRHQNNTFTFDYTTRATTSTFLIPPTALKTMTWVFLNFTNLCFLGHNLTFLKHFFKSPSCEDLSNILICSQMSDNIKGYSSTTLSCKFM